MLIGLEHLILEWLKTRRGQIVGSIVSCVVTTATATLLVPLGVRQVTLYRTAVLVEARVVERRTYYDTDTRRTPLRGAVRYAFEVAGRSYHFAGVSGNEWATVPLETLEALSPGGRVPVAYAPADPTNNVPAVDLKWLWAWGVGFVTVPVLLAAAAWVWVRRVFRRAA